MIARACRAGGRRIPSSFSFAHVTETIRHALVVPRPRDEAFALFAERLGSWWPREYTWSQQVLEAIGIEPYAGGLCYERGPHGFRCDWGRVLAWQPPQRLLLAWQISPRREPEPNPARASTVEVCFEARTPNSTHVVLEHRDFERHGDGATEYRAALASPQGWPYIMQCFAATLRTQTPRRVDGANAEGWADGNGEHGDGEGRVAP